MAMENTSELQAVVQASRIRNSNNNVDALFRMRDKLEQDWVRGMDDAQLNQRINWHQNTRSLYHSSVGSTVLTWLMAVVAYFQHLDWLYYVAMATTVVMLVLVFQGRRWGARAKYWLPRLLKERARREAAVKIRIVK